MHARASGSTSARASSGRASASPRRPASRLGRGRCCHRTPFRGRRRSRPLASWSAQSTSANGAPYSCQGRPQCALTRPGTRRPSCGCAPRGTRGSRRTGNGGLSGLPLTLRSTSGYSAQPVALLPSVSFGAALEATRARSRRPPRSRATRRPRSASSAGPSGREELLVLSCRAGTGRAPSPSAGTAPRARRTPPRSSRSRSSTSSQRPAPARRAARWPAARVRQPS